MSDHFSTYDEATQRHILELGCFIYEKSLDHYRENYRLSESNVVTAVEGRILPYEYDKLKQQVENLSARVFEVRDEEYKKGETKIAEYKQQLAAERQRLDKILATIQSDTDRQIAAKTEHLNNKIS
jgi:hypothetical protein